MTVYYHTFDIYICDPSVESQLIDQQHYVYLPIYHEWLRVRIPAAVKLRHVVILVSVDVECAHRSQTLQPVGPSSPKKHFRGDTLKDTQGRQCDFSLFTIRLFLLLSADPLLPARLFFCHCFVGSNVQPGDTLKDGAALTTEHRWSEFDITRLVAVSVCVKLLWREI